MGRMEEVEEKNGVMGERGGRNLPQIQISDKFRFKSRVPRVVEDFW